MAELYWCNDVNGKMTPQRKPTATDALEYANDELDDDDEMSCCEHDVRIKEFSNIKELLST